MNAQKPMNRWWVVFGAILIQLCLGAIYAWSVFTPALMAEGWSKLQTQLVFAVGLASFAAVMLVAGRKLNDWGPRRLAMAGGIILGAGYLIAGLSGGTGFWPVLLGVGLVGGAGIGLGYVVPIAVGMNWFPDHKGLITGLAVAGFGFGAMAWVKLAGAWGELIATIGLAHTFVVYGVLFAALVLVGSLWMRMPPAGWRPAGYQPPSARAGAGGEEFTAGEMLRTPQFYLIFLTFAVSAGAGLMSIGLMKLYPMEALLAHGYGAAQASAIAGTAMAVFFSIANGIGRIVWGVVSDRLGRKYSVMAMAASQGVILLAFTAMAGNEYLLYLGAALIGFNFGGNFALFPALTADEFGNRAVGRNYPYLFLSYGAGGILFPILGGVLGDMGNFPLAFSICGVACLAGAAALSLVSPPRREEAHRPFSVHGFFHQLHLLEPQESAAEGR
ncbi:L-lactate MFS transporter [Endothiovibrio diazotrophicus]